MPEHRRGTRQHPRAAGIECHAERRPHAKRRDVFEPAKRREQQRQLRRVHREKQKVPGARHRVLQHVREGFPVVQLSGSTVRQSSVQPYGTGESPSPSGVRADRTALESRASQEPQSRSPRRAQRHGTAPCSAAGPRHTDATGAQSGGGDVGRSRCALLLQVHFPDTRAGRPGGGNGASICRICRWVIIGRETRHPWGTVRADDAHIRRRKRWTAHIRSHSGSGSHRSGPAGRAIVVAAGHRPRSGHLIGMVVSAASAVAAAI